MDDTSNLSLDTALATLTAFITEFGLKIVGGVVLLVVGVWISKRVRNLVQNHLGRANVDPTLVPFVAKLLYAGLIAFVLIAVVGVLGVPIAQFVVVLGAAGLAIGLALQGTLSNFAAGVMLLLFRPFSVGHWVEIGGTAGTVKEISIFSTILHTGDNIRVVVPNSQVYGQTIRNYSANPTRRIDLVIGVGYDDNLQVAKETMLRVLTSDSRVLEDPAPNVQVAELGDSSVDFIVRPWCAATDYWALRWDLLRALKEELEAAGCNIPYPQRDVHLHQVPMPVPGDAA
ncbi:MAG: mechanosensitive ion channel family protein [Gemmatimonadales bacterium]|nr:MAG: mechanosensitive ion channel family protein [Gemmatimonadales bacterium]